MINEFFRLNKRQEKCTGYDLHVNEKTWSELPLFYKKKDCTMEVRSNESQRYFFRNSSARFTLVWIGSAIRIGDGLSESLLYRPVDIQNAGDVSDRIFVVEQAGRIHVFENAQGAPSTGIFLDIRDRVNSAGNEEGLLGLAFHPDYENNDYFFVDYTASSPRRTVIARYSVSGINPDDADESSELILLEIEQPYSDHNGGQIAFGPEGYLYISLGDGGAAGDPEGHGQNLPSVLGSILRIDVDNPDEGLN